MLKFALAENIVISGPKSDGDRKKLQDTTHDVASQAYAHLDTARTLLQKNAYKNQGIYALLNAVPTNMYLELLQDHDSDPFATCIASSQRTHLKLQWNLFKTSVTKTF